MSRSNRPAPAGPERRGLLVVFILIAIALGALYSIFRPLLLARRRAAHAHAGLGITFQKPPRPVMRIVMIAGVVFIGCLVALFLIGMLGLAIEQRHPGAASKPSSTASENPSSDTRHHLFGGHLSMRKYDQIANGMTYDEVVGVLGRGGVEAASAGAADDATAVYSWTNFSGANVTVEFQNGHVVGKAQAGLY